MNMYYLSELVGSFIFLAGGFAYGANTSLKKTFLGKFNPVTCAFAWGTSLAFGVAIAIAMGGPACLNPAVALGLLITRDMTGAQFGMILLMEFIAAGLAVLFTWMFYYKNFKETTEGSKRGIFAAYPVEYDLWVNFAQEIMCSVIFIFILFMTLYNNLPDNIPGLGQVGIAGNSLVTLFTIIWIAYTYSSTGFSMNPMRSVFSSIWYAIFPIANKNDKVDWKYQIIVNVFGSTIGMVIGVVLAQLVKRALGA